MRIVNDTERKEQRNPLLLALVVLVLFGVGIRAVEGHRKSLWLDEFHTIWVSEGETVGEVIDRIRPDFHAPLYFCAVWAGHGQDPHDLRWLSILGGLLGLPFLLAILRDGGVSRAGRFVAAAAMMFLPYQILYGTELRPYAFLQTASLAIVWSATSTRASLRLRHITLIAATAIGLYTHYLTAVCVLGVGASRLFVHGAGMMSFRRVVLGCTIGVVLFAPWIVSVESWIYEDPGVMTRDEAEDHGEVKAGASMRKRPRAAVAREGAYGIPRLAIPSISILGSPAGPVAAGGVALAVLLAVAASFRRRRALPSSLNRVLLAALLAAFFALGLLLATCIEVWQRIPIQYGAIGAWLICALLGLAAHRAGTKQALAIAAVLLVAGLAHAFGAPREDLRTGVETAVHESEANKAHLTAVLRQPALYPHLPPVVLYSTSGLGIEPHDIPADGRSVVVVGRNVTPNPDEKVWTKILAGRRLVRTISIDRFIQVFVFEAER